MRNGIRVHGLDAARGQVDRPRLCDQGERAAGRPRAVVQGNVGANSTMPQPTLTCTIPSPELCSGPSRFVGVGV